MHNSLGKLDDYSYAKMLLEGGIYENFLSGDWMKVLSTYVGIARACKCYQDACPSSAPALSDAGKCRTILYPKDAKRISEDVKEVRTGRYQVHAPPYCWVIRGDCIYRTGVEGCPDEYLITIYNFEALRPACGKLLRSLHNNELKEDLRIYADEALLEKCKTLSVQASSVACTVLEGVVRGRENCLLTIAAAEGHVFRTMKYELLDGRQRLALFEIWICCMLRLMEAEKVRIAVAELHAKMVCCAKLAEIDKPPVKATEWERTSFDHLREHCGVLSKLRVSCAVPLSQTIQVQYDWEVNGHEGCRSDDCITELEEFGTCSHMNTEKSRKMQGDMEGRQRRKA
jgi:hypothetical protein